MFLVFLLGKLCTLLTRLYFRQLSLLVSSSLSYAEYLFSLLFFNVAVFSTQKFYFSKLFRTSFFTFSAVTLRYNYSSFFVHHCCNSLAMMTIFFSPGKTCALKLVVDMNGISSFLEYLFTSATHSCFCITT